MAHRHFLKALHTPYLSVPPIIPTLASCYIHILCTLPVTSCSSKRSFSALKWVKTSIRSCMSNERLNLLTLLHVHTDIAIDIPQVIEEFSRHHPRRLRLTNILSND